MKLRISAFRPDDLSLVTKLAPVDPPLSFGEWVILNSGGPAGLVVDIQHDLLTVAWGDEEIVIHRDCLKR
jgi:hypothetical protein